MRTVPLEVSFLALTFALAGCGAAGDDVNRPANSDTGGSTGTGGAIGSGGSGADSPPPTGLGTNQGESTAHICEVDTTRKGGVFSDSDGTAKPIDESFVLPVESTDNMNPSGYDQLGGQIFLSGNQNQAGISRLDAFKSSGSPESAHRVLRYVQAAARNAPVIGYDGVSAEGLNYHFLWLKDLLKMGHAILGHQDPDSWQPPAGVKKITTPWTHLDTMPPSSRWNTFIENAAKLTLPDATDCGIHDSGTNVWDGVDPSKAPHWGDGGQHYGYSIERAARSYLLGGFGQLGLGDGTLDNFEHQTLSLLHFSHKMRVTGHAARDTLMLGLYGRGRSLLSFPGHNTQSHGPQNKNMVVVNEGEQNKDTSDLHGRVELFAALPGIQVARVDGSHIMQGGNSNGTDGVFMHRYRRTLLQNTVTPEASYLLDIFEVEGGDQHDYLIRGSEVLSQSFPTSNLPTAKGVMPLPDSKSANFDESATQMAAFGGDQAFSVAMTFTDNAKLGSRSHFPAQGDAGELYLNWMSQAADPGGKSPFINPVPQYTLHRTGAAPLESAFVAVHEVMDGTGSSFIQSVERQTLDDSSIGITVKLTSGREDVYLVSFDGQKSMTYGGVSANTIIAASSKFNDKTDLWVFGGGEVKRDSRSIQAPVEEQTGKILAVFREEDGQGFNAFDTDMKLPLGYLLANQTLLLEASDDTETVFVDSYLIDRVEEACGRTRVHLRVDPGVSVSVSGSQVKEQYPPWREAASARLHFVPSATTVPRVVKMSPGKDPTQRINAQVGRPLDQGQDVELTVIPDNAAVAYRINGGSEAQATDKTIAVEVDAEVVAHAVNASGFVQQQAIRNRYTVFKPAVSGTASQLGLSVKPWSGFTYNFDQNDPHNQYDLTRFDREVVTGLSFSEVPYDHIGSLGGGLIITGYVDVPETGLYTFFTRMDRAVQLKVDDEVLIEERGMRMGPMWRGAVYLEKGLHKLEVQRFSAVFTHFSVLWSGPNIPLGEIPADRLYQYLD